MTRLMKAFLDYEFNESFHSAYENSSCCQNRFKETR